MDVSNGGWLERTQLTEATRPVAETAATERLDCRRAFLNIVKGGGSEDGRMNSLKERCNWGEEIGERREKVVDGKELSSGGGGQDSQDSR